MHNMGGLGFSEIMIIVLIIVILFGAKKIPDLMKGVGKGIREFSDAKNNTRRELEEMGQPPLTK